MLSSWYIQIRTMKPSQTEIYTYWRFQPNCFSDEHRILHKQGENKTSWKPLTKHPGESFRSAFRFVVSVQLCAVCRWTHHFQGAKMPSQIPQKQWGPDLPPNWSMYPQKSPWTTQIITNLSKLEGQGAPNKWNNKCPAFLLSFKHCILGKEGSENS